MKKGRYSFFSICSLLLLFEMSGTGGISFENDIFFKDNHKNEEGKESRECQQVFCMVDICVPFSLCSNFAFYILNVLLHITLLYYYHHHRRTNNNNYANSQTKKMWMANSMRTISGHRFSFVGRFLWNTSWWNGPRKRNQKEEIVEFYVHCVGRWALLGIHWRSHWILNVCQLMSTACVCLM